MSVGAALLLAAAPAFTQTAAAPPPTLPSETRPATTTPMGDTGLWFVPTAEILPAKRWSASAYRVNFDYQQGFTDVSNWPVTFGYGLKDRVELFGSWTLVRRIDRDVRPIFRPTNTHVGGLINDYPWVNGGWSGSDLGDLWLGGKVNFMSEWQQKPMALAVRAMFKLPTANDDPGGVGSGNVDFLFDFIGSKEINQKVELSGYAGYIVRGDPADLALSDGFRWGFGAGFPTRKSLRVTAELHGEAQFDDVGYSGGALLVGEDGSIPPAVSDADSATHFTVGLTWLSKKGFFAGAGANWRFGMDGREAAGSEFGNVSGDSFGFQARIGYHPGVRIYVPPAASAAAPAPAGARQAGSRAGREGVVRAVHGGSGPAVHRVGRGEQLDRLHGDLQLVGTRRHADEPHRAEHALDGAEHRRHRPGHGHGDLPAGWQDGERHRQHQRHPAGGETDRVRRRALRLRPLLAAAGSDTRARRSDYRDAAERDPAACRSRGTPATSARPSTTSRSAIAARTRCATT